MKKKLLAILLMTVMVVSMLPVSVYALDSCVEGEHDWRTTGTGANGYAYCYKSGCDVECHHEGTLSLGEVNTCKNNSGLKWGKINCTVCGYSYNGSHGEGSDHVFTDDNPTCANCKTSNPNYCAHNWKNGYCGKCQKTCQHPGLTTTTPECGPNKAIIEDCPICDYFKSTPAPTEHSLPEGATGSVQCTTCGATVEVKEPCTNHAWGSDGKCTNDDCDEECPHTESELVYRNCVESQYDHMVCKACGVITNPAVAKDRTTHTYGEGDKCTYCGADKPEEDCNHEWDRLDGKCDKCGEAHDHNYQDIIPNCTQGGYLNQHCEGCGHTIVGNAVEKKNHNYGADGVCTVCGNVKSECTHEWNWATGQCEKCLEFHIHSDADITIDHPNCTEGGYIREICDVCGYILVKGHFTASEHEYVNGICIRCGDVEPVEPEEVEQIEEETPKKASTEGLDDVPQTGSIFLEWLYNLIFG